MTEIKLTKYEKNGEYSYSFGAFPTFELLKNKPKQVLKVIFSSKVNETEDIIKLKSLCNNLKIPFETNDKHINKIAPNDNTFVIGVFKKYDCKLKNGNNLVLVNPSDMGNMGTIMRSALGFGFENIIIVKPAVDVFNPKTIRASMGAIFSLNIVEFENIDEYLAKSTNKKYFFMLNGKKTLGNFKFEKENVDLVFGNESSGLPDFLINVDESVVIEHNNKIDSLNLPTSVGIALYEFSR
ncbi:MAG: TrmH family RNA methyltransferase [Clostridiales bacterium]|nr:TrmH family RNA methyltransferase [Clostridiales bacterium]